MEVNLLLRPSKETFPPFYIKELPSLETAWCNNFFRYIFLNLNVFIKWCPFQWPFFFAMKQKCIAGSEEDMRRIWAWMWLKLLSVCVSVRGLTTITSIRHLLFISVYVRVKAHRAILPLRGGHENTADTEEMYSGSSSASSVDSSPFNSEAVSRRHS